MRKLLFVFVFFVSFLMMGQNNTPCPCCSDHHQAFDFWLGTWEVYNPDGTLAGTNQISKIQDNCALQEHWKSANGSFTGTSYNYYNTSSKLWEQIWVDNQGGQLHLKGQFVGKQMVLKSEEFKNADGQTSYHQITWTANEDGTVRQLWETFTTGKSTQIVFDGLYKKTE